MEIPREVLQVKQRFSIIGNSPLLIQAIERAIKVAPVDLSVLVTGESGAGKEFFPRIIHSSGSRKHKKYIAVNCGAIPEGTIDSELFGHEKGSFTGAVSSRKGYFEEADGGTIFLDEVAELPLTTQARLLRVLETGEFLKVGSSEVQKTNVRIVAATNVDLLKAVARGRFREDLYYRLSTIQIQVPSLHDRGDDVILLARKFAADFSEKYMTAPITFSEDCQRAMVLYSWPGNVRQLKNAVEQLALFNAGREIDRRSLIELLPLPGEMENGIPLQQSHPYEQDREMIWQTLFSLKAEIAELRVRLGLEDEPVKHTAPLLPSAKDLIMGEDPESGSLSGSGTAIAAIPAHLTERPITLEDAERLTIMEALRRNDGDKKRTADELKISPRTLYRKISEYGIGD